MTNRPPAWRCFPLRSKALLLPVVLGWVLAAPVWAGAQAPDPLAEQLKSPDADSRAKAAREIGKSDDRAALPALEAALRDPSDKVRREVVMALAGFRQPEALDALISATRDSNPDVRTLAVESLVGYYTGQAPSPGFTGFLKRGAHAAKSIFSDEDTARIDPGVRVEPKVITALEATMQDTSSIPAAREAARGLGVLVARPAVPQLVKAAHSLDADLARGALNALAKIKDTSAGPELVDLLDSPKNEVKQDAAETVGILRTHAALPKLQAMYDKDRDKKNREVALQGLAYIGDPVSDPVFLKALWSNNKRYRALGAEGLGRARDTQAIPEIEKALGAEKDADARLAMRYALANLGRQNDLQALVDALGSTLHGDVAQAYLIELCRDPKFLPQLYPYASIGNATIRKRLCTVLVFTGDQSSFAPLERLSHDKNNDVAIEALRALRAVRARQAGSPSTSS